MTRRLHIAVVELSADLRSGTAVRGRAIARVLESRGHQVERVTPPRGTWERLVRRERSTTWRLLGSVGFRVDQYEGVADALEPLLRGRFDVVVARGLHVGHVLPRDLPALKVFDWLNVAYIEEYSTSEPDLDAVDRCFARERRVLEASDLVVSVGEHLTSFVTNNVNVAGLEAKLITAPLGGERAARTAAWAPTPRVVYAGSYYPIQDPFLLSRLTALSPFDLHCYGPKPPADGHLPTRLRYRGYAPSEDFLADYQVGLITVARDRLREVSPSTKLPYYFAHGLPVLFPEWVKEGYDYPGCAVAYTEENFAERLRQMTERSQWQRLSAAALEAAARRSWEITLAPLVEAIERLRP